MKKTITLILGTGVYFYAVTILIQYGFNSYFNIPLNFIEPSIRDNIVYFFDIFRTIGSSLTTFSILTWISLGIIFLVVWFVVVFGLIPRVISSAILLVTLLASLYGFYVLGSKAAQSTTSFRTIPFDCLDIGKEETTYIIPAFYQGEAIIVPVNSDTNTLSGGFLTRKTSELMCEIQTLNIESVVR